MKRSKILFIAALLSTLLCFLNVGQARGKDLEKDILNLLGEERLSGIAWVLVDGKGGVSTGAAGYRDNISKTAFTPDTRFHVGSLTKTLLATAVLRLATEGRLELDSPAINYLPAEFIGQLPPDFFEVSVRHLLDHTAGLNDAYLWQMFSEHAHQDAGLRAAFPDPGSQLELRSRPGSRFSYSNMGYTLLGMLVENVVRTRYETYLDDRFLAPLGLHQSTFEFTTQVGAMADPTLAWGHVDDGSHYAAVPIFLRPAGQFTSTAADLGRLALFLMSNGEVEGQTFVDPALLRAQGKPVGTEAAEEGLAAGYALGLGRRDRHGVVGYCHAGNIVGFVAMLCIYPDQHKAFAYSINTDSESADYGRFEQHFIQALGLEAAQPPRSTRPAADTRNWHGRYVLSPNRFRSFEYLDTLFGAIELSSDQDSLVINSLQSGTRVLRPVGEKLYSADDRTTASHVLFRGSQGEFLLSDGFQTYKKVSSAYYLAYWVSLVPGLAGLVWTLLAGTAGLARYRLGLLSRPLAPAYIATLLLFAPIPFFLAQSFMALGDITAASGLLALVTLLLPAGMLLTIFLVLRDRRKQWLNLVHGLAAAFVLQWCIVLMVSGMLPFRLWA